MILYDSTDKNRFSKHKNEAEFKCLDDSKVLRGDFPGLKTSAASMNSVASTASMATDPDGLIIYGTKMTNIMILAPFLWETVEATQCYFF